MYTYYIYINAPCMRGILKGGCYGRAGEHRVQCVLSDYLPESSIDAENKWIRMKW